MAVHFVFSPEAGEVFFVSQILVIIAAIFLMSLAIKAYKNTGLKKIFYVIGAFALFAIQHVINYIDEADDFLPDDVRYAIFSIITLSIMGMFFLAIIKK